MVAANSRGWEIQEFKRGSGWIPFSLPGAPFPTPTEAYKALEKIAANDSEYRVYEALTFPLKGNNHQS